SDTSTKTTTTTNFNVPRNLPVSSSSGALYDELTKLNAGDCIKDPGPGTVWNLEQTTCGGTGVLEVTGIVKVTGYIEFPGASALDELANSRCPYSSTIYYEPTPESWNMGDREITCVK